MYRRTIRLSILCATAGLLASAGVAAAKPSIAVLGLEVKAAGGNVDEKTTNVAVKLTEALRARAKQPSGPYKLAPQSDKELVELKMFSGCDEGAQCMSEIGKELGADRLLYGRITRRKGGFQVSLDLLDVGAASMERSTSELIPFDQANPKGLSTWARSLYNRLTGIPEEGVLIISANVSGGTVLIDGEVKTTLVDGSARIEGLSEGSHTLGVEAPGHDTYAGEVEINAGETTELEVTMAAVAVGGGDKKKKQKKSTGRPGGASRALFWTSLVLTGAGATAMTVTGLQVRGSLKDDQLAAVQDLANRQTNPIQLDRDNACSDAENRDQGDAGVKAVLDACDAGKSRAMLTNVFLGATLVSAVAASYFYYNGYVAAGDGRAERQSRRRSKKRDKTVRVIPQLTPTQVGAGVAFEF